MNRHACIRNLGSLQKQIKSWIVPENAGDSHHETDGMETNAAKGVDGSILAALDTYMSPLLIAEEETFTCLGV